MAREPKKPPRRRPKVWLVRWRVLRTNLETHHFVGYSVEGDHGCVSTPITTYDCATRVGVTTNGRPYKLLGPPGYDDEAEYVWKHYKQLWKFTYVVDVSNEYQRVTGHSTCRTKSLSGNGGVGTVSYGLRKGPC